MLVVYGGAFDVGVDGQRGENQIDLLVVEIPQRFGHYRALDGDQLVQLVLKLEVRIMAGVELEKPKDGNSREQHQWDDERKKFCPDRGER